MTKKIGALHPESKLVKATNKEQKICMEVRGVRALAATIWGRTPAGVPRKVAGVIEMCNNQTARSDIDGWVFEYVDPTPDSEDKEVFVDPLEELGI